MLHDIQKSIESIKSHHSEDALLLLAKRALIEALLCKLEKGNEVSPEFAFDFAYKINKATSKYLRKQESIH